jgi:CubicO group peptidase (beta-lactamase class C family)
MQEVTSTAFDETAFISLDRNRGPFYVAPWRVAMCAAACVAACTPSSERASTDGTSADAALGGSADAGVVDGGSAFDQQMLERMQVAQIPGLAAVVVRGDQIVFARGYGVADFATGAMVTPDTLFGIASLSKTVTATAVMQEVEAGAIGLDDDVDPALAFTARNPSFPSSPVTARMLLSHTASIHDSAILFDYTVTGADSPIALRPFISGYLTPGGTYYKAANWNATAPGTAYQYSNAGVDLAGELVEQLVATDLQTYSESNIFLPLGMMESSWFLAGLDQSHIAMPYTVDVSGDYVAAGYYCYPDYPNGQLRTSANQLARFLMMFAGGGALDGTRVLAASSVTEMETTQPSSYEGLSWESFSFGGHAVLGHSGIDTGISTDMWFDPTTGAGFIVLTNSDVFQTYLSQFEDGNYGPQIQAVVDLETDLLALGEQ